MIGQMGDELQPEFTGEDCHRSLLGPYVLSVQQNCPKNVYPPTKSKIPLSSPPVRTGNKGNKRAGDIGNSFYGRSDWTQRCEVGDSEGPTRSRSFVISEM